MLNVTGLTVERKTKFVKNGAAKVLPALTKGHPDVTSEMMLITPDIARLWRDQKHFERQRFLASHNISRLSYEINRSRFVAGTQIFLAVLPNGAEVILNGNHTLEAIALCGIAQFLTITRHPVRDINEAGMIYATFDNQKKRTFVDSMRASGKCPNFKDARALGAAVSCILVGFEWKGGKSVKPHADILEKIDDYDDAAETFGELLLGASKECIRFIKRAAIMAVALETIRYQPSLAQEFWSNIAHDNGLREGMPEHAFLRFLRTGQLNRIHWARAAALAWNAKFQQRELTMIKAGVWKRFVLLGTPHDKGVVTK